MASQRTIVLGGPRHIKDLAEHGNHGGACVCIAMLPQLLFRHDHLPHEEHNLAAQALSDLLMLEKVPYRHA